MKKAVGTLYSFIASEIIFKISSKFHQYYRQYFSLQDSKCPQLTNASDAKRAELKLQQFRQGVSSIPQQNSAGPGATGTASRQLPKLPNSFIHSFIELNFK